MFAPEATDGEMPVLPAVLGEVLQPGHDVLIDDGHVHLKVEEVEHGRARCLVLVGGVVTSAKGVNVPGVPIPIPSLTNKDRVDLDLALNLGVDFVALSFVRSASDVREMRALLSGADPEVHVIAKIEKAEAVAALPRIAVEADALMVARGDLGVEIGPASGAALAEADHPCRPRPRKAGDHRDADARFDGAPARAHARGGE